MRTISKIKFPLLLNSNVHYFDYAATAIMPKEVMDAWLSYHSTINVFLGKGESILSQNASKEFHECTKTIKRFFRASESDQIIYGKNVTELINVIALSIEKNINPMDVIIVGPFEHHSNMLPWKYLARKKNAIFFELPIDNNGVPQYEYIKEIKGNIKIFACSSISNSNGFELDLNAILDSLPSDTLVFVDESQSVAHKEAIYNNRISCRFVSSHKMYGPQNIAGAIVTKDIISKLSPVFLGGGMIEYSGFEDKWKKESEGFLAGTYDIGLIKGWAKACDFIESISFETIQNFEKRIITRIKNKLNRLHNYRILSCDESQSLITFTHLMHHAHDISHYMSRNNIVVRSGHLCATGSIRRMNSHAVTRISVGLGVKEKDIKLLFQCLERLNDDGVFYNTTIQKYATQPEDHLIIPDSVLVQEGVACGDAMSISGENNRGTVRFNIHITDGCILSHAMAGYLNERYNSLNIDYLKQEIDALINNEDQTLKDLWKTFELQPLEQRKECLLSPIKLLMSFLLQLSTSEQTVYLYKDTSQSLDCDACVRGACVNWNGAGKVVQRADYPIYPREYIRKWYLLSKMDLSVKEKQALIKAVPTINEYDFEFLERKKITQCLFSNLTALGKTDLLSSPFWKSIYYQLHKKQIVSREVEEITLFLQKIKASFIKGKSTSQLYEKQNFVRSHNDYDILCFSETDAWKLGCFLMKRGYCLLKDIFSIKQIQQDGKMLFQGHFHMLKLLDAQYEIMIDINFPGFPLGRIGVFFPKHTGVYLQNEEQFIITLCHLFKHRDVFMKDINDLYMLIAHTPLDYKKLNKLICAYHLNYFASVALEYIFKEYKLSLITKKTIRNSLTLEQDPLESIKWWPYDYEDNLCVKKRDLGVRKTYQDDYPRIFMLPLITLSSPLDPELIDAFERHFNCITRLSESILIITENKIRIIITGMGVFLDSNLSDGNSIDREDVRKVIKKVVDIGLIDLNKYLPLPIATKTKKWFY